MTDWAFGALCLVGLIVVGAALEMFLRRNAPRKPLVDRMNLDTITGDPPRHDGIDMAIVNRALRRNEQGGAMDSRITRTHLVHTAKSTAEYTAMFVPDRAKRKDDT